MELFGNTRFLVFAGLVLLMTTCFSSATAGDTLSGFTVMGGRGEAVPLSNYKDVPAVLVVNVASKCGYTDTNYRQLQTLRAKYDEDKLAILAFPCNQFGGQEPGTYDEIVNFVDKEFSVTFPIMEKIDVNGDKADPIFTWLKNASGNALSIPWNFTKFLVLCDGKEIKRYSEKVNPLQIEADIANAIERGCPLRDQEL